jgi:hypothetical protein
LHFWEHCQAQVCTVDPRGSSAFGKTWHANREMVPLLHFHVYFCFCLWDEIASANCRTYYHSRAINVLHAAFDTLNVVS